jgi:hypothetical protein
MAANLATVSDWTYVGSAIQYDKSNILLSSTCHVILYHLIAHEVYQK